MELIRNVCVCVCLKWCHINLFVGFSGCGLISYLILLSYMVGAIVSLFKRNLFPLARLASFYLTQFSGFVQRSGWLLVDKHLCVLQRDSLSCRYISIIIETKMALSQSVLESTLFASQGISVHFHSWDTLSFLFTEVQHRNAHIIIALMIQSTCL